MGCFRRTAGNNTRSPFSLFGFQGRQLEVDAASKLAAVVRRHQIADRDVQRLGEPSEQVHRDYLATLLDVGDGGPANTDCGGEAALR